MNSAQRAGAWNRLGLFIGLAASGCAPPLDQLLVGSYVGATCETTGAASVYYLRQILFSPLNYSSTIRFYSDSACTSFTLLYEQQGPYRLGQPAAGVADATEVELDAAVRVLTAPTAAAAATTAVFVIVRTALAICAHASVLLPSAFVLARSPARGYSEEKRSCWPPCSRGRRN